MIRLRHFLTPASAVLLRLLAAFLALLTSSVRAIAAEPAPVSAAKITVNSASATASSASVFTMLLGLATVLALLVALAWLFKRSGLVKGSGSNAVIKIMGGINLGTRERVIVLEVATQWIVVGVAPGCINTLATMPRPEQVAQVPEAPTSAVPTRNFSSWLKPMLKQRHDRP